MRLAPTRGRRKPEVQMSPLIDVIFLLLIFFMITASFSMQKSQQSTPPEPDEDGASQSVSMEELEEERSDVKFAVMAFDSPEAGIIRNDDACRGFMGLPFTMYYKNGKVAHATSSIQNMQQVTDILDAKFSTSNVESA